jgi:hypothetical protein
MSRFGLYDILNAIKANNVNLVSQILNSQDGLTFIAMDDIMGIGNLLHYTVQQGDYPAIVRLLITNGVNKNTKNSNNDTVLQVAQKYNRKESIKELNTFIPQWLKNMMYTNKKQDVGNSTSTFKSEDSLSDSGGARRKKSKKSRKSKKSKKSRKSRKSRK